MHQLWDKLFKIIGEHFPQDIIRFVFPDRDIEFKSKYEQEKVIIQYQIADINFWVKEKGEKKLLNIEPYSSWHKNIARKVFTRNAIITKSLKHKVEVFSAVVVLSQKPRQGKYEIRLGNDRNIYRFPVITFGNLEEILQKYPPLAPLILKIEPSYEKQVIEKVKHDRTLMAITSLVLNKLGYSQQEALTMTGLKLQEFRQALLDVPILSDLWKEDTIKAKVEGHLEGKMEGKQEGRLEGLKEGKVSDLLKILSLKFGDISQIADRVRQIDSMTELDDLLTAAIKCSSLDEFKKYVK